MQLQTRHQLIPKGGLELAWPFRDSALSLGKLSSLPFAAAAVDCPKQGSVLELRAIPGEGLN